MPHNSVKEKAKTPKWAVAMALLLLLTQLQGLMPLLFAGVAWVDGEHHVKLGSSQEGFELLLTHDANAASGTAYAYDHQHCLMDRVLVSFSEPGSTRQQDHTFSFRSTDQTENNRQLKALSSSEPERPVTQLLEVVVETTLADESLVIRPHSHPLCRPPPSLAETSFVRHTVLLI